MKTRGLLRRFLTAVNFAVALAFLTPHLRAAEKPASRQNTPPAAAEPDTSGFDLTITDGTIAWKNGTKVKIEAILANVVDALRERYTEANIVMSPGLGKLKIGDLKLRAGRLTDELEAVRVASGLKFDWMGPRSPMPNMANPSAIDPATGLPVPGSEPDTGLFVLREPAPTPESQRTVEVFNLSGYLQHLEQKDEKDVQKSLHQVRAIISSALSSLKADPDALGFEFHPGANLLVVIGTNESLDVARKVVTALPGQAGFPGVGMSGAGGPSGGFGAPPAGSPEDAFRSRYGLTPGQPPGTKPPR